MTHPWQLLPSPDAIGPRNWFLHHGFLCASSNGLYARPYAWVRTVFDILKNWRVLILRGQEGFALSTPVG